MKKHTNTILAAAVAGGYMGKKSAKKTAERATQNEPKQPSKAALVVATVVAIIVATVVIAAFTGGEKDNASDEFTEHDAELLCQDAYLLEKYIDLSKINIIALGNYNKQFTQGLGWYDIDGNEIWALTWNGKNKVTGDIVPFACWASGNTEDNFNLQWLTADGIDLYGDANYPIYDKDGNKME